MFHHRKCNSYHIFPKSLTEAVPPVLPPVLDHLILGGQHGAVADGELPEPLPLPHLRRVIAEHKLKWLNFSFYFNISFLLPVRNHLLDDVMIYAKLFNKIGGRGTLHNAM